MLAGGPAVWGLHAVLRPCLVCCARLAGACPWTLLAAWPALSSLALCGSSPRLPAASDQPRPCRRTEPPRLQAHAPPRLPALGLRDGRAGAGGQPRGGGPPRPGAPGRAANTRGALPAQPRRPGGALRPRRPRRRGGNRHCHPPSSDAAAGGAGAARLGGAAAAGGADGRGADAAQLCLTLAVSCAPVPRLHGC